MDATGKKGAVPGDIQHEKKNSGEGSNIDPRIDETVGNDYSSQGTGEAKMKVDDRTSNDESSPSSGNDATETKKTVQGIIQQYEKKSSDELNRVHPDNDKNEKIENETAGGEAKERRPIKSSDKEHSVDPGYNQAVSNDDKFQDARETMEMYQDTSTVKSSPQSGGETAPKNVRLTLDTDNPHIAMQLSWEKAKRDPETYSVTVIEMYENGATSDSRSFETADTKATIPNLHHLTKYYCKVVAKYLQGETGKPILSNSLETTDLPPESFKPNKVRVKNDPDNSSRQVIVKWEAPETMWEKLTISYYEVHLTYNKNAKTQTQTIKGKYQCRFENLKSSTAYKASVVAVKTAIGIQVSKSKESLSDVVVTAPAQRTQGFDIKTEGQPIIKTCEPNYKTNSKTVTGSLEWALPDFGIEKNNYQLLCTNAYVETEEGKKKLPVGKQTKCKPIPLERGRTYTFTVECVYLNLDSDDRIEATTLRYLTTDIEKLSINNIRCQEQIIEINWSKSKGAVKHFLTILDEKQNILLDLKEFEERQNPIRVSMKNSYSYGKTCEFVIEASGRNGQITKSSEKIVLGGEVVATDVVIAKNGIRGMIVTWKPPTQVPKEFKLLLHEMSNENIGKADVCCEMTINEPTCTSHSFIQLKSNTSYFCQVYPIYHKGAGNGSMSNVAKTGQRMHYLQEKNSKFGKPETINHNTVAMGNNCVTIKVWWSEVKVGENFKLTGYRIILKQKTRFSFAELLKKPIDPKKRTITKELDKGYQYQLEIYTIFEDLDNLNQVEKLSLYDFTTSPSQTKISDCTWREGVIFFNWLPVNGATKYCLTIKDEFCNEEMAPEQTSQVMEDGGGCQAQVQMSEKLGIGRTCMAKVTVHAASMSSVTEWKPYLIGGDKVVRNVKATRNTENPTRALNIVFDSPKAGAAEEYKVVAVPESGRSKTQYTKSSPFVFEYLRKGISYHCEMFAKKGESWGLPSRSNSILMEGQKSKAVLDFKGMVQSKIDLRGAAVREESTVINVVKGNDFGKVRDLEPIMKDAPKSDLMKLHWLTPDFDHKSFDYKMERFKVDIRKPNLEGRTYYLDFDKAEMEYSTQEYDLDLGASYDVSVSTIYEDIDRDIEYISSAAKCQINTRPCKPIIQRNECNTDPLTIEWNKVKGARIYEVELHMENLPVPYIKETPDTKFTKEFDETFGYGTTYYAVVKAIGEDNKFNQANTKRQTIGGEYVPTNVFASIDHPDVKDPNTEVFLSWKPSQHKPEKYEIEPVPAAPEIRAAHHVDETCLVSGLKAGTQYYFKVTAFHQRGDGIIKSGGSCSNKVQTNPTPTQVKNVNTRPGDNPSTSVDVFWEKVDAEKENESTTYKVCVGREDGTVKRKVTSETECATFHDLYPGASYFVTVSGGNSIGFGRKSEKTTFITDLGTPKNASLKNCANNPSTSLVITFSLAEGDVLKYEGTLYKIQNKVKDQIRELKDMKSGNVVSNLESNSEYAIGLHAVTKTGAGKSVSSNIQMTAPPQVIIDEYGCCAQDGEFSSREIFAKWKAYPGCDYHEVKILCGPTQSFESKFVVQDNNQIKYSCLHESTQYSIQVRSRNASMHFGKYSDLKIIDLAPAKLKDVNAELSEVGCDIKVRCRRAQLHAYLMNAYCEGKVVTKEPEMKQPSDESAVIEWTFTPENPARKYIFELWGENSGKVKGKSVYTSFVTSRPSREEIQSIKTFGSSPSTDICISWKGQERCDAYEISIRIKEKQEYENLVRCSQTSCTYRCLSPGNTYLVSVRAFSGPVWGYWSDKKPITLAPNEIQLIEDQTETSDPVSSVNVKWKPLSVEPDGYTVKLFCDGEEVAENKTLETEHLFNESLSPGSLCYCTVSAYNGKKIGKTTKSKDCKIKWSSPGFFFIFPDENEPSRKAKMEWEHPTGVTSFKLEIENNQTGVITPSVLNEARYVFESGVPGNTYSVRLYCGCGDRYDTNFSQKCMEMSPEPPTQIKVLANKEMKGLTVEFKDSVSARKSYEICIEPLRTPEDKITIKTKQQSWIQRNLVPGESYKVMVNTLVESSRSNIVTSNGYIPTLPDAVQNLRSKLENGRVIFEWDELEIIPDEYIVRWAVNNQPISEYSTQTTTFSIDGVKPAHWYHVIVMASNSSGRGPMTPRETVLSVPDTVKNLRCKLENGSVIYEWDAPDIKPDEYIVEWAVNNRPISEHRTKMTTFSIKEVEPAHWYHASVMASNSSGCGPATPRETVLSVPEVVKNLRSKLENGSVIFEWDAPDMKPDEYIVQWAVNNQPISEHRTEETNFSIKGVEPAHWYHASVMACNSSGCGPMTSRETVLSVPDTVKNLRSKLENDSVIFEWDAPVIKPDEYIVQLAVNDQPISEHRTQMTNFSINRVEPAHWYHASVIASNTSGRGPATPRETVLSVPDSVKNLRSTLEKNSVIFEWDAPDIKPDEYIVQLAVNDQPISEHRTQMTNFSINGVEPAHWYHASVIASNTSGRGPATPRETVLSVPDSVKNLRSKLEKNSVIFEWDAPDIKPDEYIVQWAVNNQPISEHRTQETNFSIKGVEPAHWYHASVMACNSSGRGPMTSRETVLSAPGTVKNLRSKLENGTVIFEWDAPDIKPDEYIVQWAVNNQPISEHRTRITNFSINGAEPATWYHASAMAYNSSGRGPMTPRETFFSVPDAVTNLRSKLEEGKIVFEWDALDIKPDKYIVLWAVNNQPVSEHFTDLTTFSIYGVEPAHWYHASVVASYRSGRGPMTPRETFLTDPLPPTAVTVCKDEDSPTTCLIVKFQDDRNPLKSYRVAALVENEEVKVVTTKYHFAQLTDLKPGQAYFITVQTIFCGKISDKATNSRY